MCVCPLQATDGHVFFHARAQTRPAPPQKVGPERYRAPECLFHPEQLGSESMGVHDCLLKGIMRTDMDMRRTLFGQVVLSGGSTLFPGFGDRLLNEVSAETRFGSNGPVL